MLTLFLCSHERWVICCRIARYSRLMVRPSLASPRLTSRTDAPHPNQFEETWKWAHLRKSQGKRLIDQPVVRNKCVTALSLSLTASPSSC